MVYNIKMLEARRVVVLSVINKLSNNIETIPIHILTELDNIINNHLYIQKKCTYDELVVKFKESGLIQQLRINLDDRITSKVDTIKAIRNYFKDDNTACTLTHAMQLLEEIVVPL